MTMYFVRKYKFRFPKGKKLGFEIFHVGEFPQLSEWWKAQGHTGQWEVHELYCFSFTFYPWKGKETDQGFGGGEQKANKDEGM